MRSGFLLTKLVLISIAAVAFAGERDTGDNLNVDLLGRWGSGPCLGSTAVGDIAYFGDGAILRIVDYSTPATPVELGHVLLLGPIYDIEVVGNHAYIGTVSDGMRIVDVSNPAVPFEVGGIVFPQATMDVAISGNIAVAALRGEGIRVVDISNPAAPAEVGSLASVGDLFAVAVSGDYAYVSGYTEDFDVVDISDPAAPVLVGSSDDLNGAGYSISTSGDHAFVATADHIHVFNVADAANPIEVVQTTSEMGIRHFSATMAGDYLYVAQFDNSEDELNPVGRLEIMQWNAGPLPVSLVSAGTLALPTIAEHVGIDNGQAFVCLHEMGLMVVDVSAPAAPAEVVSYQTSGETLGVAVVNNLAYMTSAARGLNIVDMAQSPPTLVGQAELDAYPQQVVVKGDHAYIAASVSGLRIVDVSNPGAPEEVGFLSTGDYFNDVDVRNDRAYVALYFGGLGIIDISTPATPVMLSYLEPAQGNGNRVVVQHPYAYLAKRSHGVSIYDISDSNAPVETGFYDFDYYLDNVEDIAVEGNYLFVADHREDKLHVVDISDPVNPFEVTSRPTYGDAYGICIHNGFAYVAATLAGLRVFDISTPTNPTEVGYFDTGHRAYTPTVGVNSIAVADWDDGAWFLVNSLATPVSLVSFSASAGAGSVTLRWEISEQSGLAQFRLLRRHGGSEVEIEWIQEGPGRYVALDSGALIRDGGHFDYQLYGRESGEMWQMLGNRILELESAPAAVSLHEAWPNPFNPKTSIRFDLAEEGSLYLAIYNAKGGLVKTLHDSPMLAGEHTVDWDGRNDSGEVVGSGLYLVILRAHGESQSRKVTLLR